MFFIAMLVFQLAGALILLLNCCIGSRKAVIRSCFPGSNIVQPDGNNECIIPKDKLRASAHKIYLNMAAFLDLVIGYLLAAFSPESSFSQFVTIVSVVVITAILLLAEFFGSKGLAAVNYSKDIKLPYSELKEEGVDTTMPPEKMDEALHTMEDVQNALLGIEGGE